MNELALILGPGVVAAVLIAIAMLLKDPELKIVRIFLLFFAFQCIMIVALSTFRAERDCSMQVNQTSVTGNFTSYTYRQVCAGESVIGDMMIKTMMRAQDLIFWLILLFGVYSLLTGIKDRVREEFGGRR